MSKYHNDANYIVRLKEYCNIKGVALSHSGSEKYYIKFNISIYQIEKLQIPS
jgi:hypothetical protein